MDFSAALKLARQIMDQHGCNLPLRVNGGKTVIGMLMWKKNFLTGEYIPTRLVLSRYLIVLNDEDQIKEVVLHEIAHFKVNPKNGHNWAWQQMARQLGCKEGRCSVNTNMPEGRYKAECSCGQVYYKHRAGKRVLHSNWFCRKCRGKIRFVDTLAPRIQEPVAQSLLEYHI